MHNLTPTELRGNLYKVLDSIIATGQPVEISRGGEKLELRLKSKKKKGGKTSWLDKLPRRDIINGDPDDLIHLKLWEWDPDYNMDPTKYPDKHK